MIKVLLADDEKKVCQLITHLVDWGELGFEIVGIVNDGESAYRMVKEKDVDVMITDIRMPECDGMELIEKTKALHPEIHFVIISGYSQFDYAQNAIRYGVEDYLLKPIRKKDLLATLQKISEKYKVELKNVAKWETMQKSLQENEKKLKGNLLHDMTSRVEEFAGVGKEQINKDYHCHFTDDIYQTAIIKPILASRDGKTRTMLLKKALQIVEQDVGSVCHECVIAVIKEDIYCIFNGSTEEIEQAYKKLKKAKLDIIRLQDVFEQVSVFIALGEIVSEFQDVLNGFSSAAEAMNERFYSGGKSFLLRNESENQAEAVRKIMNNAFKKRFLSYIEIMDLDSIHAEMDKIRDMLVSSEVKAGEVVVRVYEEILTLFYLGVHNYNITIENQYAELLEEFQRTGTIEEAVDTLKIYIVDALSTWFQQKKYVDSKPIRVAKQYIARNYYQPITLEMVSSEIGFNPSYFSSMFKKETGMNFSEYLLKIRIDNAKEMLLGSDEQVADISEAVGYQDIKYFSKIFKKMTGLTPTEFRRLYN